MSDYAVSMKLYNLQISMKEYSINSRNIQIICFRTKNRGAATARTPVTLVFMFYTINAMVSAITIPKQITIKIKPTMSIFFARFWLSSYLAPRFKKIPAKPISR